jgi:DNA repair protein RecN (Recombination protein N)
MKLAELAAESSAIAAELNAELASFLADLDADPALLEKLMSRKAQLVALERKYGISITELIEAIPAINSEILDLDSSDEQLEKLEMQLAASESQLGQLARELTRLRVEAGNRLSTEVSRELAGLAMGGSRFDVKISELADFESTGCDRVEFLLSAHPGAEPRPLGKGASGGELSRIMLAIELVLAAGQQLPTMIFDEVDAGVGGAAAVELGKRLKQLSRSTQVIVVTHLPQVAAYADSQIRVAKDSAGEFTVSSVKQLTQAEREVELARMLSGSADSELAISHARELLNSAN